MNTSRIANCLIAATLVAAFTADVRAAVLNVNWDSPAYTGTAAAPDTGTTWNNLTLADVNHSASFNSLSFSDGSLQSRDRWQI